MIRISRNTSTMIAVFVIVTITTMNVLFCMHILSSWTLSVQLQQFPVMFLHSNEDQERRHEHHNQQPKSPRNKHVPHEFEVTNTSTENVTQLYLGFEDTVFSSKTKATTTTAPQQKQPQQQQQQQKFQLRLDWTNLKRYSSLAKQVSVMQQNCSNTKGYFWSRNKSGLGSDLHYYSIALCNALESNYGYSSNEKFDGNGHDGGGLRVITLRPWIWYSNSDCSDSNTSLSAMKCYFPEAEPECNNDTDASASEFLKPPSSPLISINMTRRLGGITQNCSNVIASVDNNVSMVRAAITEFLFTRVSQIVQQEGQRQLNLVFSRPDLNQNRNSPNASVIANGIPKNLITVHVRWGDKGREMSLSPISKYIVAIEQILQRRRTNRNAKVPMYNDHVDASDPNEVNVFLATEDPEAVMEFQRAAPNEWNIYIDQYYTENLIYRQNIGNVYNVNTITALQSNGRTGLLALGSLLVAMEANDYVLTTGSNWSRLMNEIRINILNPRCHNCTTMIDLKRGES